MCSAVGREEDYTIEPGANLHEANLHGADLYRANLTGANLTYTTLCAAYLSDVKGLAQ